MMTKSEYEQEYQTMDWVILWATKAILWGYGLLSLLAYVAGHESKATLLAVWGIGVYLCRRSYIETIHEEIDEDIARMEAESASLVLSDWHSQHMDKFKRIAKDSDIAK